MQRPIFFTLSSCILLFFAGCGFMFPLYTEKDVYTDTKFLGNWTRFNSTADGGPAFIKDETIKVEQVNKNSYMVMQENGSTLLVFHYVTFVKIKDKLFIDEQLSQNGDPRGLTEDHNFGKAYMKGDTIVVNMLNDDYIEQQIKDGKLKLKHSYSAGNHMSDGMGSGPSLMIQESTESLQRFMLSLYDNKDAFIGEMYFVKEKD